MGALQELSLLTGIISKTALPGTNINKHTKLKQTLLLLCLIFFPFPFYIHIHVSDAMNGGVHVLLGLSGVLEMGGEVNSAALMEFQGHINRFQVRHFSIVFIHWRV